MRPRGRRVCSTARQVVFAASSAPCYCILMHGLYERLNCSCACKGEPPTLFIWNCRVIEISGSRSSIGVSGGRFLFAVLCRELWNLQRSLQPSTPSGPVTHWGRRQFNSNSVPHMKENWPSPCVCRGSTGSLLSSHWSKHTHNVYSFKVWYDCDYFKRVLYYIGIVLVCIFKHLM